MKYRIVKRAKGWRVQEFCFPPALGLPASPHPHLKGEWLNIASWRWRFLAALHLLWLRERARK